MKKIILLLLSTIASYGQAVFDEGIQITNTESTTATKVNVQEANGKVNIQTIKTGFNKNIGLGGSDVVGATTLLNQYSTTPIDWTATAFNSGQVVFYGGKQWIAKIATVAGDVPSVSSKWEEITFDALANKTVIVDAIPTDGSNNAVSSNGVFDALATKAPISSVHNPVTLGTANGLSLSTQQLSLGLANSGVTGALSGTDWNTFNNKQNALGFVPENVANKSNSYTVSSTTTYPNTKALVDGLSTKQNTLTNPITGSLTTGYIPMASGTNSLSDSILINSSGRLFNGKDDGINTFQFTGSTRILSGNFNIDPNLALVWGATGATNFAQSYYNSTSKKLIFTKSNGTNTLEIEDSSGNVNVPFNLSATTYTGGATLTGTPTAPTAPAGTNTTQIATTAFVQAAARPYKVYTALLSQTGTNAPVATVLENTLGGTIVWSRLSTGTYVGTLAGAFAVKKTICFHQRSSDLTSSSAFDYVMSSSQVSTNTVDLISTLAGGLADGLIIRSSVEIRVYN